MQQLIRKRIFRIVGTLILVSLFAVQVSEAGEGNPKHSKAKSVSSKSKKSTSKSKVTATRSKTSVAKSKTAKSKVSISKTAIKRVSKPSAWVSSKKQLFDSLHLDELGLSRKVFEFALHGMDKLRRTDRIHSNIITIADFSKSSTEKRLFVIDLDTKEILYNTWVAHGKNSGKETANIFSNKVQSNKSSLGFYVTGSAYNGSNGYSMKLMGMESGFNSNAFKRAIVLHGADYVNTDYINSQGYIGRSQGCPAVMPEISAALIDSIKEGSCLFIYHPSSTYISRSSLLR
ncbi:MAG: murein L,D-transpeptidase catalytic domain family protein [Chitinophagaceae bacterium]|nr:murein L,D-transpeptidase catalytic domain family protein [Chitinophagaceae bacterium]